MLSPWEVLILEGQTGIGDPVGVRFVIDPPKAVVLRGRCSRCGNYQHIWCRRALHYTR